MPREIAITVAEIARGMDLRVSPDPTSSWSQGGRVTHIRPDGGIDLVAGTARVHVEWTAEQLANARIFREVPMDATECDEYADDKEHCQGTVDYRHGMSGSGRGSVRCDAHFDAYYERMDKLRRNYPDSPIAPSWFDPTAIGEVWDDSDY